MAIATAAAIGLGLTAFSVGTQAYAQYRSGKDAERAALLGGGGGGGPDPAVLEALAQDAERRGELEELQLRQRVRHAIGQQRAGYASQNIDVRVGSAVDVQADTAYNAEVDAQNIRANAAREAWGIRARAFAGGGSSGPRYSGAGTAGKFAAIGTIASGAASIFGALGQLRTPTTTAPAPTVRYDGPIYGPGY